MPIRKFRSVAEMTAPSSYRRGDPENLHVALALSELCHRLRPLIPPPGVHRHRSAEEAWEARQAWETRSCQPD